MEIIIVVATLVGIFFIILSMVQPYADAPKYIVAGMFSLLGAFIAFYTTATIYTGVTYTDVATSTLSKSPNVTKVIIKRCRERKYYIDVDDCVSATHYIKADNLARLISENDI